MKAIEVRDLVKVYGRIRAVDGISFDVRPGEFFGLLGPNGAGKSTTLNILAGLTRPSSGLAKVMGYDVVSEYRISRRNLGVVPQEISTDRFLPVWRLLKTQSGFFGIEGNEDWIEEILVRLHLWEHRDKKGYELSGGMKRRLLVAKALVHKPPVVILDEPTAGVDVELRRDFWSFIHDLHREGTTILLTTHYLEEAETRCERIGILGGGRLLALESTKALLRKHTDRKVLLRFVRPLDGVPQALQGFAPRLLDDGCALGLVCHGVEDRERLWRAVMEAGLEIRDIEVVRPDLEDVFLELTRNGRSGKVGGEKPEAAGVRRERR